MRLPYYKDDNQTMTLLQNGWSRIINPILSNPVNNSSQLKGITLVAGDNVINTKLGKKAQGWIVSDINAAVQIYRSAPFNDLTLTLNSSGNAVIDLVIF